jgi:hypothetical protein
METYLKESSPVKPAISETSHEDETSEFQRSLLEDQNKAEYSDSKQSDKKPYAD